MSFIDRSVLGTGEKYFVTDESLDALSQAVEKLISADSDQNLTGRWDSNKHTGKVMVQASPSASMFEPELVLQLEQEDEKTEVQCAARLKPYCRFPIVFSLNFLIGGTLATAASSFLVPHPAIFAYAFFFLVILPAIAFAILFCLARLKLRPKAERLQDTVISALSKQMLGDLQDAAKSLPSYALADYMPGFLGMLLAGGLAFGLHAYAFQAWLAGDYAKSEAFCRPVLLLSQTALRQDNAVVADCRYYVAECLRCQKKLDEAEALYKETVEQMERTLGKEHAYEGDNSYNLGRVYDEKGKLDAAAASYKKAIEIWGSPRYGADWLVNQVQNRLAMVYLKQGKLAEAEELQRQVVKKDSKRFGSDSITAAQDKNDLALILQHEGKAQEAELLYKQALDTKKRRLGEKHYSYANTLYNLASLDQQQTGAVSDRKEKALAIWKAYIPAGAPAEISELYQRVTHLNQPDYEIPNYAMRTDSVYPHSTRY